MQQDAVPAKVTYYLRFTPESKEASSAYSKDDLWIISSSPDFTARYADSTAMYLIPLRDAK